MEKEKKTEKEKKVSYKTSKTSGSYKTTIIIWLCGVWSLGLGARMSLELLLSDGWVHVPKNAGYGCNLWFDFIPLCVFGCVTVFYTTKELFKVAQKKGWVDVV